MYAERILERYRNPKNKGKLENFDLKIKEFNTICGDHVEIFIKLDKSKIVEVKFSGEGCAISQASCDLLLDYIKGKDLDEVKKIDEKFLIDNILKIPISYRRIPCATLSLKAILKVLQK